MSNKINECRVRNNMSKEKKLSQFQRGMMLLVSGIATFIFMWSFNYIAMVSCPQNGGTFGLAFILIFELIGVIISIFGVYVLAKELLKKNRRKR
jgi:hypothetical protein